jgi:hypothetical protein
VAATARNIVADQPLFRLAIACDLVYALGVVVALVALYVILREVGRGLALLGALCRLVYGLTWVYTVLGLFTALRLLTSADATRVFGAEQVPHLARIFFSGYDGYYVGLLFYGVGTTAIGWLWWRSHFIPRAVALLVGLGAAFCTLCTAAFLLDPGFARVVNLWWFDTPLGLGEIATSLWLLIRGLRPPASPDAPRSLGVAAA